MAFLVKKGRVYHLSWRDESGRERWKTLQTSNHKVAQQRLKLFESEFQRRKWQFEAESLECSVDVFWAKYVEHVERTCRPNTVRNKRSSWQNFLRLLQPSFLGLWPGQQNDFVGADVAVQRHVARLGDFVDGVLLHAGDEVDPGFGPAGELLVIVVGAVHGHDGSGV